MVLESEQEQHEKVHSFTMSFRIFDPDAYEMALEDLQNAEVWAEDEGPQDNTIEENLEILVKHLDVLAYYRERQNIAFMDIGIEQVVNPADRLAAG